VPSRRQLLAAGTVTAAIAGSGGYLTLTVGDDEYTAAPSSIPSEVLQSTGYELTERRDVDQSRSISIAGVGRTIEVTNRRSIYEKPLDLGFGEFRVANVTVVSTPSIQILGEERNPVAGESDKEFARRAEADSESLQNLERTSERTTTMLGQTVTVGRYRGVNRSNRLPVEVNIVAEIVDPIPHADGYVTAVCVYPTFIEQSESENVTRMLEHLRHGAPVEGKNDSARSGNRTG